MSGCLTVIMPCVNGWGRRQTLCRIVFFFRRYWQTTQNPVTADMGCTAVTVFPHLAMLSRWTADEHQQHDMNGQLSSTVLKQARASGAKPFSPLNEVLATTAGLARPHDSLLHLVHILNGELLTCKHTCMRGAHRCFQTG